MANEHFGKSWGGSASTTKRYALNEKREGQNMTNLEQRLREGLAGKVIPYLATKNPSDATRLIEATLAAVMEVLSGWEGKTQHCPECERLARQVERLEKKCRFHDNTIILWHDYVTRAGKRVDDLQNIIDAHRQQQVSITAVYAVRNNEWQTDGVLPPKTEEGG